MRMPAIPRGRALAYLALVLGLLALGGRFLLGGGSAALESAPVETLAPVAAASPGATEAAPLVVHVVGAVRRPGIYRLPEGSRVADAVERAGGATRRAELGLVNLAAPLVDGQQVLVPRRGAGGPATSGAPGGAPSPLSLSTATLEQLDGLPGVGPVTAQRILDHRERHGPFASVDELDAVPGIGPARLEQLRELVVP
ncbi:MAG: ComEA family DNA-binding protein [Thermoleophilia bacterium]|nr:ComEA family DNA-binding protein [Thermoleophilia bacterium]